ncbi:MAG: hypothetical protein PHE26_06140 [Syntrophomonadaceae bacterium]|nr:hypothetical protein [Syntrophomonadaceae bacterium]
MLPSVQGGTILTSPDGQAWRPLDSGTTQDLYGIIWDGNQFIVVGTNGTILAANKLLA